MARKEVRECYEDIMALMGFDDFKKMITRFLKKLDSSNSYSIDKASIPNLLLFAQHGSGISTLCKSYTDFLYSAKAIDFCGRERYFEVKLEYTMPGDYLMEIARLENAFSDYAGYNLYFKGIACIDITAWLGHALEKHFLEILEYIACINDKCVVIFYAHIDNYEENKKDYEQMQQVISSIISIELMMPRFPTPIELVELVETHCNSNGYVLTKSAKVLLADTIEEIASGAMFNGFKTIYKLCEDISYHTSTSDIVGKKSISAKILSPFAKNSIYVKSASMQPNNETKKRIGFKINTEEKSHAERQL